MGVQTYCLLLQSNILKKRGDDIYDCIYIKSKIERYLRRQTNRVMQYIVLSK